MINPWFVQGPFSAFEPLNEPGFFPWLPAFMWKFPNDKSRNWNRFWNDRNLLFYIKGMKVSRSTESSWSSVDSRDWVLWISQAVELQVSLWFRPICRLLFADGDECCHTYSMTQCIMLIRVTEASACERWHNEGRKDLCLCHDVMSILKLIWIYTKIPRVCL